MWREYAAASAAILPHQEERIDSLGSWIESVLTREYPGEPVPTHGDFYTAQILLGGVGDSGEQSVECAQGEADQSPHVSALFDLDRVGPGYRVDDYACLLGHLSVQVGTQQLLTWWHACAVEDLKARGVCQEALDARCAAVALSLVPGQTRLPGWESEAARRLDVACAWQKSGHSMPASMQ